ncbi:MAG TPA: hypothetical protein PKJ63_00035 [Cyclobacteriaceae bacterium]|nr:hypothetical protein [Cyclobacteriaceae bacterium]
MKRKSTKHTPQKGEKKEAGEPERNPASRENQDEDSGNRPDFGGLPDRDLKKNLGCG